MTIQPNRFPSAQRAAEYRRKGYWGDATLLDYWNMAVLAQSEKMAVIDNRGGQYTYGALDAQADLLAAWLRKTGVETGDVVTVQLPGWVEFTLIYVACLKVGAVVNPVIAAYRGHEMAYFINTCKPKVVFMPYEFRRFNFVSLGTTLQETASEPFCAVYVDKTLPQDTRETSPHNECMGYSSRPSEVQDCKVRPLSVQSRGEQKTLTLSSLLEQSRKASFVQPSDKGKEGEGSQTKNEDKQTSRSRAQADDVAAVLFTSGTEKRPKGVLLTHNTIIASIRSFAASLNLNSRDVVFMPSPVGHATGFHHGVTTPFMLGGTSVLQDTFNAEEALELIKHEKCTYGMGAAPFVYDLACAMGRVPYDISSLRFFLCGGASSPRHLLDSLWERGFKVINVYGSTESVPHTASSLLSEREILFATDGSPVAGCEVRVVDSQHNPVPVGVEGEECSRGPNVFVGYLGEPELTKATLDEEGWYYSGDLCVMTDKGQVRIIGRKKDIIVRGGENISSREVEDLLLTHPHIGEAAVVGMPDARLGERVCAYVVLKGDFTFEDMRQHFSQSCVTKCKYPERMESIAAIPKNPVGKVRKDVLRRDIAEKVRLEQAITGHTEDHVARASSVVGKKCSNTKNTTSVVELLATITLG